MFWLLLGCSLLAADQFSPRLHKMRQFVGAAFYPIQAAVDSPIRAGYWLINSLRTQQTLLQDNSELQAKLRFLNAKLQTLVKLQDENSHLHALLSARSRLPQKVLTANLLAINSGAQQRALILDRGSSSGAVIGEPVVDAYGVCGMIVDTTPLTAKVLLLNDQRSAIPVEDYRSGVRALAQGQSGNLDLQDVPSTADVEVGDLMVASGLGLRYPAGYPVGVVSDCQKVAGDSFMKIKLHLSAHLHSSRQFLLVESSKAAQHLQAKKILSKAIPVLGGSANG